MWFRFRSKRGRDEIRRWGRDPCPPPSTRAWTRKKSLGGQSGRRRAQPATKPPRSPFASSPPPSNGSQNEKSRNKNGAGLFQKRFGWEYDTLMPRSMPVRSGQGWAAGCIGRPALNPWLTSGWVGLVRALSDDASGRIFFGVGRGRSNK